MFFNLKSVPVPSQFLLLHLRPQFLLLLFFAIAESLDGFISEEGSITVSTDADGPLLPTDFARFLEVPVFGKSLPCRSKGLVGDP